MNEPEIDEEYDRYDARQVLGDSILYHQYNNWLRIETVYDIIEHKETIIEKDSVGDEVVYRAENYIEKFGESDSTVAHLI